MVPSVSFILIAICTFLLYRSPLNLPCYPSQFFHLAHYLPFTSYFHSDTWRPRVFGGAPTPQAAINHGTYFYHAHAEGLLANDSNIHAGIRTTLSGLSDYDNDGYCGFEIVEAREIDTIGTAGIIKKIRERVGKKPVYLSIDIDTLDPACMLYISPSLHTSSHHPSLH